MAGDLARIGEAIKRERVRKGWSQRKLAALAELDHAAISRIEGGQGKDLRSESLRRVASVFGMTPDELLGTARPSAEPPEAPHFGPVVLIPLVNISLAAGQTVYGETRETVPVPAELVAGRQLVAARVSGDCLQPEIMAGDVVIVDVSDRNPRPGDIVAVLMPDGGMMVKRFERRDGEPVLLDNQGGQHRPNGAKVQGVVVSVVRQYRR